MSPIADNSGWSLLDRGSRVSRRWTAMSAAASSSPATSAASRIALTPDLASCR